MVWFVEFLCYVGFKFKLTWSKVGTNRDPALRLISLKLLLTIPIPLETLPEVTQGIPAPIITTTKTTPGIPLPITAPSPNTTSLPPPNFMLKRLKHFMIKRLNRASKTINGQQTTQISTTTAQLMTPRTDPCVLPSNHISITVESDELNSNPQAATAIAAPPAHALPLPQFPPGKSETSTNKKDKQTEKENKTSHLISVRQKQRVSTTKNRRGKNEKYDSRSSPRQLNKRINNYLSNISSASDSEFDYHVKTGGFPNQSPDRGYYGKHHDNSKKRLNPQRSWGSEYDEGRCHNAQNLNSWSKPRDHNNHNYYSNSSTITNSVKFSSNPQAQRFSARTRRNENRGNLTNDEQIHRKRLPSSGDQNKVGDLVSMSRKVSTRFFLTMCQTDMNEQNVKKYIKDNFPNVLDVFARKLLMNHTDYSSFIFFTNTNEEVDIEEFQQHKWPGVIKCFFAPRDKNRRY